MRGASLGRRDCPCRVAGQELDLGAEVAFHCRKHPSGAALDQLGAELADERVRLLDAPEHRECRRPVRP